MREVEPYSEEYERATPRLYPPEKSFLLERMCAELGWMSVCPLYPFRGCEDELFSAKEPCQFLIDKEHEGYSCPNIVSIGSIAEVISREGTSEQKRALEHFADMSLRYGSMDNPPATPCRECLDDAYCIYSALGLENKRELAKQAMIEKGKKEGREYAPEFWENTS